MSDWPHTLYLGLILAASGLSAWTAFLAWPRRALTGGGLFFWLSLTITEWNLTTALQALSNSATGQIFWTRWHYLGTALIGPLFLLFVLEYLRRIHPQSAWRWLLFVFPALTQAAVWTNDWHHLVWRSAFFDPAHQMLFWERGPWFWAIVLYLYALVSLASLILLWASLQFSRIYRLQALAIIAAVLIPFFSGLIYLIPGLGPPGYNLTPALLSLSGFLMLLAIFRLRLLELQPIASKTLLNALQEAILVIDDDQRVVEMNRAALYLFQVDPGRAIGRTVDLVTARLPEFADRLRALVDSPLIEFTPMLIQEPHGDWYEVRLAMLDDRLGKTGKHLVTLYNITSAKQTEDSLGRLAAVIEQASESVLLTDLNGRIVYVNPAFERVTGYTASEALGHTPALLKSGHQDEAFYRNLWGEVLGGNIWQGVFVNRRKDGSLYHEQGSVFPIKDPDGQIINLAAVKRDITAEVEAEQTLRERERSMRLLNEITHAASTAAELPEMLQTLADQMGNLIQADACYITLWDEVNRRAIAAAASGELSSTYRALQIQPGEPSLTEIVLQANHWMVVEDTIHSPYISPRVAAKLPAQSLLGLPLIADQKKLGAALISFNEHHTFTSQEIALCEQAASQLSLAIAKTHALEEAQRQAREADLLRQAGEAVASTLNQEEVIQRILEQVRRVIPYDSASVSLLRPDGVLEIVGGVGFAELPRVLGLRFVLDETTPCTQVVHTGQPVILDDAPTRYETFRHPPHNHIHGWLGTPLIVKDQVIGLIAIDSVQAGAFSARHAQLAASIAGPMAVALENTRLFEATQRLAITDSLTGLYNRRHFFELARRSFEYALRYQRPLGAIMLDIDHFKHINDTYGHKTGDQVLQAVSELCQASIRKVDLIGRYGGEEFVIVMPETDLERAEQAAERLRQIVAAEAIQTQVGPVRVAISLGVHAETPAPNNETNLESEIEKLIDRADQALLISKHSGRNRVTTWDAAAPVDTAT